MSISSIRLLRRKGPPIAEIVAAVGVLITAGKARAWGIGNWEPADLAQAAALASELGVPPPCAGQLPYSVARREYADGSAAVDALDRSGVGVVASFVLAGLRPFGGSPSSWSLRYETASSGCAD